MKAFKCLIILAILSMFRSESTWDDYIPHIVNKMNYNTNTFEVLNVCTYAAIVSNTDGDVWASTDGFALRTYNFDLEQEDGTTKEIQVDEFACLLSAFKNKGRSILPAGIRINNTKYMLRIYEKNVLVLSRLFGGGAFVAKTKSAFVIAVWDKLNKMVNMENGVENYQNAHQAREACVDMQEYLLGLGY